MDVRDGRHYQFSWSTDSKTWTPAPPEIDGDYLPPWDRAVRAGLFVMGEPGASGRFDGFSLGYAPHK
jgi:hypothetical protein